MTMDMLMAPTKQQSAFTIKPVTKDSLTELGRLRYDCYSEKAFIDKSEQASFLDQYDYFSTSHSYFLYKSDEVIGAIRGCIYDPELPFDLPAMGCFREEIDQHFGLNEKILEANKFIISPEFQKKSGKQARFMLLLEMCKLAKSQNIKNVILAIRDVHIRFYTSLFDCQVISEPKPFPDLNLSAVLIKVTDIDSVTKKLVQLCR